MTRVLRDYQTTFVNNCAAAFRAGKVSVCGVLPTGGGKTACAIDMSLRHIALYGPGASIVWLAPLKELVRQARGAFPSNLSVVTSDEDTEPQETMFPRVHISTVHALANTGYRPRATMLVLDEAQYFFGTPQWNTVVKDYLALGTRVLSLTATPVRADGTPLNELADELIIGPSVRELIAWRGPNGERALVPCRVIGPDKEERWLAENPVAAYQTYAPGTKAAVFCQDVAQAKALAEQFNAAGITAVSVDSKDRSGIDAHRDGRAKVLCNVFMLSVGYDDPSIETIIMARGMSNVSTYLQVAGRGLRASPGKTLATIIDLKGIVHQYGFGLPDEPRAYSLGGRAIKLVTKKKRPEPLKVCDVCKAMFRPGETACQCTPEIKPAGPSVVEVRRKTLQEIRAVEPFEIKRSYYEKYVVIARKNKMKPAAAAFMFKKRYGQFPPMEWMR